MFDLEKELISISRFRQCPDDALREGTRIMVRRECRRAQTAGGRHLFQAKRPRLKWLAWVATAAAAALALMLVLSPAPTAQAAGYYTIDINPSVILRVDDGDIVLLASAGNAEASLLLDGLTLAGLDIGDALESIVRAAVQAGYFHVKGHVLVAHFGDTPGLTEQRAAQIVSSAAGESVSVMLLQSTKAEFESAGKAQKSAGIELLKKNARKLGLDETMDLSGMITALQERATQGHDAGS